MCSSLEVIHLLLASTMTYDSDLLFQELFHPKELKAMVVGNENYDFHELEKVCSFTFLTY